jgi:hypothetical protein
MALSGRFVLTQVLEIAHRQLLARCVERYQGEFKVQHFTCREQFICLAFAQLTYRESLRDIEVCLNARPERLYHLGFDHPVARSTLAEANESRDWRIYQDLAQALIRRARRLYAGDDLDVDLGQTVYALDSTTIELCLSLFPWARYQRTCGAIKLHTLLDLRGPIPSFVHFSDGKMADVTVLDSIIPEPGSFYLMDRGYVDQQRLFRMAQAGAYFVTRTKTSLRLARRQSRPVDMATGLRSDQTVVFATRAGRANYPEPLRRIRFKDPETGKSLTFLTNNFDLPALTIARLYQLRWRVELFFKWIKGHLRVRAFYGTSSNAVQTQVWIAICVYVMVAILKKELALPLSLHTMLQILSVNVFEKVPLAELFAKVPLQMKETNCSNQLIFNAL